MSRPPSPLPLLVPDLPSPQALLPYLERMHQARHYSNFGPLVVELESRLLQRFAARSPGPLALSTVANATLGIELVLSALGLAPGSRVLVPALTFVATATAVLRAGHVPVVGDVDAQTWALSPDIARQALRQTRIDAVVPVATFGVPQAMAGWQAFEEDCGIPVVVDAAGAFGSQWLETGRGTAVFSMHATKSLPGGEGGFVVSSDAALVARIRQMSNFGINLDPRAGRPVGQLARIGTNAKLSEYHAAVALASLDVWERRAAVRRGCHASLQAALDDVAGPGVLRWQLGSAGLAAPTLFCVRLPDAVARRRLEDACADRAIGLRRWYQPLLPTMLEIADGPEYLPTPAAEAIADDLCGLPFFPAMLPADIHRLAEVLGAALDPKPSTSDRHATRIPAGRPA